jgi:hypothetical protein
MIEFIIGAISGFISGLLIKSLYNTITHTHKYDVLFNRKALEIGIHWHNSYGYGVSDSMVSVVYKKCSVCGKEVISVSDGSTASFSYDRDHVLSIVKAIIKKESTP